MKALLALVALLALSVAPAKAQIVGVEGGLLQALVFNDANGNGTREPGEANVLGVEVTATGPDGVPHKQTTSSIGGIEGANFGGVAAGEWKLEIGSGAVVPVAPASGRTTITIQTGFNNGTAMFGVRAGSITGRVTPAKAGSVVSIDGPRQQLLETAADGTFRSAPVLLAGRYTATAREPGKASSSTTVDVEAGGSAQVSDLKLARKPLPKLFKRPSALIIGRRTATPGRPVTLLDPDLKPIAGAPKMPADTLLADLSPDAKQVAAFSHDIAMTGDSQLDIYRVRGGKHVRTVVVPAHDFNADPVRTVSWISPTRILIVYGSFLQTTTRVAVVDTTTGTVTRADLPGGYVATQRVGDRQLVISGDAFSESTLSVLDPDGNVTHALPLGTYPSLNGNRVLLHDALGNSKLLEIDPRTGQTNERTLVDTGFASWMPYEPYERPALRTFDRILTLDVDTLGVTQIIPENNAVGDGRGGFLAFTRSLTPLGTERWRTKSGFSTRLAFGKRIYNPQIVCEEPYGVKMTIRNAKTGRVISTSRKRYLLQAPTLGNDSAISFGLSGDEDSGPGGYGEC